MLVVECLQVRHTQLIRAYEFSVRVTPWYGKIDSNYESFQGAAVNSLRNHEDLHFYVQKFIRVAFQLI